MTITTREKVRAAVERAQQFGGSVEAAMHVAAAALCLPIEAVRDALEAPVDEEA